MLGIKVCFGSMREVSALFANKSNCPHRIGLEFRNNDLLPHMDNPSFPKPLKLAMGAP